MREKIKTIWFKLAILIIVAGMSGIISYSFFYHYVIFLPQKEQGRIKAQKEEQRLKEQKEQQVLEQKHKEYVAKRKMKCYEIYMREREQFNNVENFGYVESYNTDGTPDYRDDTCEIIYKNNKTGEYFRKYY